MRIYISRDYKEMSRKAANIISAQIILKPDCILGLATGSTPLGIYDQLVEWYEKGDLDFSEVTTVNLDEYKGLGAENEQSYIHFMRKNLFDRVNLKSENVHMPDGRIADSEEACREYNALLAKIGEPDLQLLGLGRNGHIGFNEPGNIFEKDVHCVELTQSTIEANHRFFNSDNGEEVPTHAYTMGIRSILRAKKILVVASGSEKADAVQKVFFGPVTPEVPGSILQLHDDVTLVADEAAFAKARASGM